MMLYTGMEKKFRRQAWEEAVHVATILGDLFPTPRSQKSAYELFFDNKCKWYDFLIEYGRVGIVTNKKKGRKL